MILETNASGPESAPILFFIHGWPDTSDLWATQVAYFSEQYRCICVDLPNFKNITCPTSSFDFPELTESLAETIQQLTQDLDSKKVTLISHDWGAYLSYLLEQNHPELIERMVTMDVGGHLKASSLKHFLSMVGYQWWLIAAFLIGYLLPSLGNWMTRKFAKVARAPHANSPHIQFKMNYLYLYIWRGLICKKYRASILKRYQPLAPLLFLYGRKKPFMFHSSYWEKTLTKLHHCEVLEFSDCGHWLMIDNPERTNTEIQKWLETKKPAGDTTTNGVKL